MAKVRIDDIIKPLLPVKHKIGSKMLTFYPSQVKINHSATINGIIKQEEGSQESKDFKFVALWLWYAMGERCKRHFLDGTDKYALPSFDVFFKFLAKQPANVITQLNLIYTQIKAMNDPSWSPEGVKKKIVMGAIMACLMMMGIVAIVRHIIF